MSELPVHSPLGASSYYRWKACPGSIRRAKGLKGFESEYARIGTLAHEVASKWLLGEHYTTDGLSEEDFEAITVYVNFVRLLKDSSHGAAEVKIENRFDLSKFYPNLYGTADAVVFHSRLNKLVVVDYKHGAGIPVEVKENTQLMYYGLGALANMDVKPSSIELVIVQPRCFHQDGPIRRWTTTPARILDFVADLVEDAKATEDPNAPLNPGDWCKFCPAAAVNCPAVREKSLALARQSFSPVESYDPEKLAEVLNMLPTMESWIKSVREFSYREAEHGRIPPGFKLVQKRANRKWKKAYQPDEIAKEFGLRSPEIFDMKLKTPAQVEKIIPKNLKERLESMAVQESAGKSLVPSSDPRPAAISGARDVFDIIE